MTIRGRVSNGVVVLEHGAALPNGTPVEATPLKERGGNAAGRIAATGAEPHLSAEDVAELGAAISDRQRDALLGLIGIWETDRPPDDDEVDRMIDHYRARTHG